jgi:putative transposase
MGSAEMLAAAIRTIFVQPDAAHDITAFADFPAPHWKKIWSTNPLERLNNRSRRRRVSAAARPGVDARPAAPRRP